MKIKVAFLRSVDELGKATDGKLDMVLLDNGIIMNCGGRSLPF